MLQASASECLVWAEMNLVKMGTSAWRVALLHVSAGDCETVVNERKVTHYIEPIDGGKYFVIRRQDLYPTCNG